MIAGKEKEKKIFFLVFLLFQCMYNNIVQVCASMYVLYIHTHNLGIGKVNDNQFNYNKSIHITMHAQLYNFVTNTSIDQSVKLPACF